MSTAHTTALLSEKEFLNLPEYQGKQELLDGELIEMPPAKDTHTLYSLQFFRVLDAVVPKRRLRLEGGYRLRRKRWLIPDVSITWPNQRKEDDWLQGAPMLAIEIVSPANSRKLIERKVRLYFEDGAAEVWMFSPKTRELVVHRPNVTHTVAPDADYVCELLGITITAADRTLEDE